MNIVPVYGDVEGREECENAADYMLLLLNTEFTPEEAATIAKAMVEKRDQGEVQDLHGFGQGLTKLIREKGIPQNKPGGDKTSNYHRLVLLANSTVRHSGNAGKDAELFDSYMAALEDNFKG
jgi:hypothetical protein